MSVERAPLDRSAPPAAEAAKAFHFPTFDHEVTGAGTRLLTCRRTSSPLVYAELVLPAGAEVEPVERAGLATLTSALLDEGTTRHSATEIAERVEGLGGFLSTSAGWNATYVAFGGLAEHFDDLLEIAAEVVTAPSFPEREVERLLAERAGELARRSVQPGALARRRLAETIYGSGVYSTPLLGTEETLPNLTREAVVDLHRRRYSPSGSALMVVGDATAEQIAASFERVLGGWRGADAPHPAIPRPAPLEERAVHIVDRPEATQTELRLGHAGVARDHSDYPTLTVMNSLLGGKFTSRLNLNLRERHGYTYGAHSQFTRRRGPGPFVVQTAVATEHAGAAVAETLGELERLRDETVSPEELDETRSYLTGVFPYTLQTNDGLAQRLVDLVLHDLPLDYWRDYLRAIDAVGEDAILEAARRHLAPDRIAVVAVGPAADLEPQLGLFGPVSVHAT